MHEYFLKVPEGTTALETFNINVQPGEKKSSSQKLTPICMKQICSFIQC